LALYLLKLSLCLSRSHHLRGVQKQLVERKVSLQALRVVWPEHPQVSPEGWRCNFLTHLEAPKVVKSQTLPAMSEANR
jgi:hypothetical protein